MSLPRRGLLYADDVYAGNAHNDAATGLAYLYDVDQLDVIYDHEETTAADYLSQLQSGYEWIQVHAHGCEYGHDFAFNNGTESKCVYPYEIANAEAKTFFFNLFTCSAAHYADPTDSVHDYGAGWYLFSGDYTVGVIGSTKTGGMYGYQPFYQALEQGKPIGEALQNWFAEMGITFPEYFYGIVLLGDPTLLSPPESSSIYISANREHSVDGNAYARGDILKQNRDGDWTMQFDASDVGVPAAVDLHAFTFLDDGSMLMTFDRSVTLRGLTEPVTPWDVVRFVPTNLGSDTAGMFMSCPFDSENFLSTSGEEIDALHYADGALYLSTTGSYTIEQQSYWGFDGKDEDIIKVVPNAELCDGQGTFWETYVHKDYSPVAGLATEDIQSLWLDGQGQPHISLTNAFTINGVSGDQKDILQLTGDGLGEYDGAYLYWSGPENGFYSAVDGLHIGQAPPLPERTSIDICVSAYPEDDTAVSFSGDLGEFTLSDPGNQCYAASELDAGTFTINAHPPADWYVEAYCIETSGGGQSQWQYAQNELTVDLDYAAVVECTFEALYHPGEPNDSMEQATPIQFGDTVEAMIDFHHEVEWYEDVDFYRFSGQAGERILVKLTGPLSLDSILELWDANGNTLAEGVIRSDGLQLDYPLPSSGEYYLVIKPLMSMSANAGPYALSLNKGLISEAVIVSANREHNVGDMQYARGDIIGRGNDVWKIMFDASSLVLTASTDVHAFTFLDDGSILMVFDRGVALPGLSGIARPWDIVRFTPEEAGDYSAGSFSWHFDGSDVGLTSTGEKIDALDEVNGELYISTLGRFSETQEGVKLIAEDEDILKFTPTEIGRNTSGTWELFLDGSALEPSLEAEDMQSLWLDEALQPHFSLTNSFDCSGTPVNQKDVLTYDTTGCRLVWHGPDQEFYSAIDGLHMVIAE